MSRDDSQVRAEIAKLHSQGYDKLNYGCGWTPLNGWTNIDGGDNNVFSAPGLENVVKLDVFESFKHVPDNQASFIFSEQFFEHFDRQQGHRIIAEWFRMLKPGGVVRIQTPDLRKEVFIYLGLLEGVSWNDTVVPHRLPQIACSKETYAKLLPGEEYLPSMLLNNGMHLDGHRYLYDFETLSQSLRLAGFTNILHVEFGHSEHPALNGINLHDGGATGRHWIPKIVLEVEATKPG